jgi:hypothetical protein
VRRASNRERRAAPSSTTLDGRGTRPGRKVAERTAPASRGQDGVPRGLTFAEALTRRTTGAQLTLIGSLDFSKPLLIMRCSA